MKDWKDEARAITLAMHRERGCNSTCLHCKAGEPRIAAALSAAYEKGLDEADTELLLLRRESTNADRIRTLTDARNALRVLRSPAKGGA